MLRCHKGIQGQGPKVKDGQHQVGHYEQRNGRHLVAREFNTGDNGGMLFAGTLGLMALRTVISRDMTKFETGAKRSINHADRCQDSPPVWRRQEVAVRVFT